MFQKAVKKKLKARIGLIGPSGSGKTFTALRIAKALGGSVAVIDTEHGAASKYVGDPDVPEFDVEELTTFSPETYSEKIREAEKAGYDVLVIDGLSHAWMGKDGALEQVDRAAKRSKSGNSFAAWRDVTPKHNELIETMLGCKMHLIVTMRSKTEYVIETDKNGKQVPRKVGMAPIQRDGLEYEFDLVAELFIDGNEFVVTKSRCRALNEYSKRQAGPDVAERMLAWLTSGEDSVPEQRPEPAEKTAEPEAADGPPEQRAGETKQKPDASTIKFYTEVDKLIARAEKALINEFGPDADAEANARYHRRLSAEGFEHRSQVTMRDERIKVFRALTEWVAELEKVQGGK